MVKSVIYNFCLVFSSAIIIGLSANGSYTRGLIKYLRKESKLYQVIFITDERMLPNSSSSVNFLVTDVSKHFPTLSTSFARMQFDFQKHLSPSLQLPRRTTLFIMILDGNQKDTWTHVSNTLSLLKLLSGGHSYPRCLINLFSQTKTQTMKKDLKFLWSRDFLDISVLEHFQENQTSLIKATGKLPILHEMNPFAKTYSARKVTARTKWFPEKLQSLYEYPIKVVFAAPEDNKTIVDYRQYHRLEMFFSRAMHCSAVTIPTRQERLQSTMYKEKAEMIFNYMVVRTSTNPKIRILKFSSVKAVIPIISRFSKVLVISQEFIYMIVATTVTIGSIRMTAWFMKFNRSTWQIFNISQIVMGMSIVRKPEKLVERIVFGVLMLSCIVYSGYFYSVILDISFRAEPQISSLEELADSSLTPVMSFFSKKSLMESSISFIQKLGSKSVTVPGVNSDYLCLAYLTKHENITCIMANAKQRVDAFKAKREHFNLKMLKEPLVYYCTSWKARNGSPFLDRFNEVILRALEYGLLTKILDFADKGLTKIAPPEEIGKEKLLLIVCYLLTIGYTLGIIVFIGEMISVICCRKLKLLFRQFINRTEE